MRFVESTSRRTSLEALDDNGEALLSAALSAAVRSSRFLVEVSGNVDAAVQADVPARSIRTHFRAALSYALGAIFPNDAIRIEGETVRYDWMGGEAPSVANTTLGLYYEARF